MQHTHTIQQSRVMSSSARVPNAEYTSGKAARKVTLISSALKSMNTACIEAKTVGSMPELTTGNFDAFPYVVKQNGKRMHALC
mmetsp:Transcript_16990/g.36927  ORF Transcript_16990/g.36927 Transcript_16990/m.36927 type:complete len:83 (-) Transcript_16990:684-932(-)